MHFIRLKEAELAGLRRLTRKADGLIKQCHDEIDGLLKEQKLIAPDSAEWLRLQNHFIGPRELWNTVLLSSLDILPILAAESEAVIRLPWRGEMGEWGERETGTFGE
ncbi:hypothetical protein GGR51DRAFT_527909 [Nemania sp. FL0031]|nr:hypothetical protein GGR51DRAFT_527909 [Nemania sp. FL0031]